ncbi:MAG: polysaccharide pyruvyl transferase family protein [Akkermansia sp.]|nr:polysaccharide pyruvyl transferase family protein [Akkermansia sp.]
MKLRVGIVSYNINCNFTNYGSALQSWALSETLRKLGYEPVLIDYCPDILRDKNPLDPMRNMWDTDAEARRQCELSLPAIRVNYEKFERFYTERFNRSSRKYFSQSFNEVDADEKLDAYVCGSDTIFCVDEFGIDDGYYANFPCMKNGHTISYAASFGDSHFTEETYALLDSRLQNFKAIGIRESGMLPYIRERVSVRLEKVLDPTLLLSVEDFQRIEAPRQEVERYILLYARRYNKKMFEYADRKAKEMGCKVIDISLRATNADKHRMFYEAGVEEFLSLVHHAEMVVTNSFHGVIVAVHYRRPFVVFSREQCDTKIDEVLELLGIPDRKVVTGEEIIDADIDYDLVHARVDEKREASLEYLRAALDF